MADPRLADLDAKLRAIRAKVLDATTGVNVVASDLRRDLFLAFAELEVETYKTVLAIIQKERPDG